MESIGRVVETREGLVTVEVKRTSACEGCHKRADGGCSVCTLMGGESSRTARTVAENPLGAEVGDTVKVESPTGKVLGLAAAVFLLPPILAAIGFAAACAITERLAWQVVGAAAGFALCFAGLRICSQVMEKRRPMATVTAILAKGDVQTEQETTLR